MRYFIIGSWLDLARRVQEEITSSVQASDRVRGLSSGALASAKPTLREQYLRPVDFQSTMTRIQTSSDRRSSHIRIRKRMPVVRTVADQFVEVLANVGVKRIYGIVGDSLNGVADAIRRQGKIEWVYVRHEQVAAFAAGAEAHLTGLLAVSPGSCGTRNLQLINGLLECHRSSIPALAVAAHIPSAEVGSSHVQEAYPQTRECNHHCELVSDADKRPRALEAAIREGVGRRGVSLVMMPNDVALQPALNSPLPTASGLLPCTPVVTASQEDLAIRTESPDMKTALNDFVELLHAHVVFAMPDRDKLVDAAGYLRNLNWAVNSSRLHPMKIYQITTTDTMPLETERCWLLGLVVKDLVTNAVRHACLFGTREGKISIELTWEGSFVHCAVSDNGTGMARARPVRGLTIAHNLARSLGGRIGHWFDDEGTSFVVTFPFTERELQEIRTPGSRYASA
jgi:two-component sensor histidine kinase